MPAYVPFFNAHVFRFAKFMDGESHLSEDESREHDDEITKIIEECDYTDDEDEF